jgi:hypothetical protein
MTALLVGFACFLAHAAVTLAWLRLPGRTPPVARHAASALGTHALGVAVAAWVVGPFAYWPAAAVSAFGAVCWLFAFSAVYKSVSLRILTQLARTAGGALPLETVTEEHVRPEFAARVAVLVAMGCAEEVEGGYAVTERGNDTARRIAAVRRACGVCGSGMYGDLANGQASAGRVSATLGRLTPGRSPKPTPPVP